MGLEGGLYIQAAKPKNPVLKGVCVGVCVCVYIGLRSQSCPSLACQINKNEDAAVSPQTSRKVSGKFADRKALKLDPVLQVLL